MPGSPTISFRPEGGEGGCQPCSADQPLAALIQDLKQRGLLDSTLLVFAGAFGRTPLADSRNVQMSEKVGRDHHPFAFSVLLARG